MNSQLDQESGPDGSKTNAELLQQKHEAAEAHNPTIEEVVDEEDLQHPPPAATAPASGGNAAMSEEAAGKKREDTRPKNDATLDTQSEESFPSLGGGPKPRVPPIAAPTWGAKKASPTVPAAVNGSSHAPTDAQPTQSRPPSGPSMSLPARAPIPPSSEPTNNAQPSTNAPMQMAMPGKYTDSITLVPALMDKSKPIQAYLDKLNKKSRATVTRHVARDGSSIVFEGSGPKKDVSEALRTIARELCVKQKLRLPVPASCRAQIIGPGGSVIQDISARTGAKIHVPKVDVPTSSQDDDDDLVTMDMEMEGDPYAVELARLDIDKIVSARTSKVNMRLKDIPPEFFPFLAGPNERRKEAMQQGKDLQIDIPHYSTWQHRPPPRISQPNERPVFQPHPGMHVQISGDRQAAQEARAQIEQHVEQLRAKLALEDQSFQRGHHQFIIGNRGMSLYDFLEETGCIAVLPPDHDDTEDITIIGPPEHLKAGVDRAATLAAEMQMAYVESRLFFANAPLGPDAHSRALSRYLQERQLERELSNLYGAQVAFPHQLGPSANWEIYSRDMKKSMLARSDLIKILQAHPPGKMTLVQVDPFFHPQLLQKCSQNLRSEYGVNMIVPRDKSSDHVVLVCEGSRDAHSPFEIPRTRPSNSDFASFEEMARLAKNQLSQLIGDSPEVVNRRVEAPRKFHEKIRRYLDQEEQRVVRPFPVQFLLGDQKQSGSEAIALLENELSLQGLAQDVDDLEIKLLALIEEAKKDELERGYTTSFDFPTKFNGYLIGREGSKIRELKDSFDVDIRTLDDGKVEVKGPKAKADACKDHINNLRKKFEDEATYVLKIEPRYHGQLVGKKGTDVNRLQDKYNVKIQFAQSSNGHDEQSNAENASEVGGRRSTRPNQAQDEVVIRGPRQGADRARAEILDLYQYAKDNSHTGTISVARQHLGSLIGTRGSGIERLRLETNAQIDFPDKEGAGDPSSRAEIVIRGTKQAVDAAQTEIRKRVKMLDETVTESMEVDRKYHGSLIGSKGSNIRRIVMEAGGPDQSHQVVKFPARDSESTTIRIEGTQSVVKQVISAIHKSVQEQANQVVEMVQVPPEKHGQLIGPGGEAKRKLEQQFNVMLEIPKRGSDRWEIKVVGVKEAVSKAREYLAGLADQRREIQTIEVPQHLHQAISANGKIFSQLKKDHGVTVDHGGQTPPPKRTSASSIPHRRPHRINGNGNTAAAAAAAGQAPLITDEVDSERTAELHTWAIFTTDLEEEREQDGTKGPSQPDSSSTILWKLTGSSPTSVTAAKERIQKALQVASQPSAVGYLTLADPRSYRFVIGPSGRNINSIRHKTGCAIQVPDARGGSGGGGEGGEDAIEVSGSVDGCEETKELILGFVRSGAAAGRA